MKWSSDAVYNWMLELAETALDIDENNVEDVEDFFRVRKMKGIARSEELRVGKEC